MMKTLEIFKKNISDIEWVNNMEKLGFSMETELNKDDSFLSYILKKDKKGIVTKEKLGYLYEKMYFYEKTEGLNSKNVRIYFDILIDSIKYNAKNCNLSFFEQLSEYMPEKESPFFNSIMMFSGSNLLRSNNEEERESIYKIFVFDQIITSYENIISKEKLDNSFLFDIELVNNYYENNKTASKDFIDRFKRYTNNKANNIDLYNSLGIKPSELMLDNLMSFILSNINNNMMKLNVDIPLLTSTLKWASDNNLNIESEYIEKMRDSKKEEIINCLTNYEKDLLSNEISEENLINTKKNRL